MSWPYHAILLISYDFIIEKSFYAFESRENVKGKFDVDVVVQCWTSEL